MRVLPTFFIMVGSSLLPLVMPEQVFSRNSSRNLAGIFSEDSKRKTWEDIRQEKKCSQVCSAKRSQSSLARITEVTIYKDEGGRELLGMTIWG